MMDFNFIDRARKRFKYEVTVRGGFSAVDVEEFFGPDAMPTRDEDTDREGRWTVADHSSVRGWQFFFLTEADAVEFKLRFG